MKTTTRLLVAALAALACAGAPAQDRAQSLAKIRLNAGIHNIDAELARTPGEHQIGLMHRISMPPNDGMLFAFDGLSQRCFWMKNTLIPLQTAFVADDGAIVNIVNMAPQTLDSHCSEKPVRYVLEMNAGWFTKRGLKPGSKLKGLPTP